MSTTTEAPTGEALTETDDKETTFTYDTGGVPLYIALVWIVFLLSYIAYMAYYGLPDFQAWTGS